MSFKYHGNWCGPGWSDGKWQNSVKDGKLPAIDALDEVCKAHDIAYAIANGDGNLEAQADYAFYKAIKWDSNIKSIAAKIGIGIQGLIKQQIYKHTLIKETNNANINPNKKQLRKSQDYADFIGKLNLICQI